MTYSRTSGSVYSEKRTTSQKLMLAEVKARREKKQAWEEVKTETIKCQDLRNLLENLLSITNGFNTISFKSDIFSIKLLLDI